MSQWQRLGLSLTLGGQREALIPISENGWALYRTQEHSGLVRSDDRAARFLEFEPSCMQLEWNTLVEQRREAELVEAMRILVPAIDSLHFLAGGQGPRVLVGQRDLNTRLPLGSYGDGMRRLLAVSLALLSVKGGYLLIDKIDTGFHWTAMADVWRFVVEAADRSNVQVFATTHSYDCIKGLGTLVRTRPELAERVAIQKVHPSLNEAVYIPSTEIPMAVEQDIEVR